MQKTTQPQPKSQLKGTETTMQEPILAPSPQLHKSKDQNSNQESNESAN